MPMMYWMSRLPSVQLGEPPVNEHGWPGQTQGRRVGHRGLHAGRREGGRGLSLVLNPL